MFNIVLMMELQKLNHQNQHLRLSGYYWGYSDEYLVKIYDISSKDINEIKLVRTLRFKDSYYNSSRVIDNNFYLILKQ